MGEGEGCFFLNFLFDIKNDVLSFKVMISLGEDLLKGDIFDTHTVRI